MKINVVLLPAGTAHAVFQGRNIMATPDTVSALDARQNTNADPCAIISKAFEAVPTSNGSAKGTFLNLRPSVGTACRKSHPLIKDRDLALLDYLQPYMEYQSTIELLKDPPPEYLVPGVDIMGGMQAIREKLKNNGYQSQLDVMTDLQNIFVAASDLHFGYTPGLFRAFNYARIGLDVASISTDGLDMPQIFATRDVSAPEDVTYTPSPIATIDGQDVYEFLENDAMRLLRGQSDPDARLNSLFASVPVEVARGFGKALTSLFEVPDNYTIVHKNGTSRVVINSITVPPGRNLTGLRSGQDFQNRFEIPPRNKIKPQTPPSQTTTSSQTRPSETRPPPPPKGPLSRYPVPMIKHSDGMVASFALNDTELRDTTVISFLGFFPLTGKDPFSPDFNESQFIREFGDVMDQTAKAAREQGRDKLIIDMSANTGGSLALADFAYTTLFPGARFDTFDRFRASGGLDFTRRLLLSNVSIGFFTNLEVLPTDPNNKTIESPDAFYGPKLVKGQNMTAAFHRDVSAPYARKPVVFLRGYEQNQAGNTSNREAPWKPQNIVILTDGLCASACSIFTGLLVRDFGIRTIALGGRPMNKPMQAIGGVKGTTLAFIAGLKNVTSRVVQAVQGSPEGRQLLHDVERSIDSIHVPNIWDDPPLLPFLEDGGDGGSVNFRNANSQDDVDGFPLHFKYEAANCRLFYTRNMVTDPTESWRRAASIAFGNGTCVPGSTVNQDGTMGATPPGFDPGVRGRAPGVSKIVTKL